MEIVYTLEALKGLKGLPKGDANRLMEALRQVAGRHPERLPYATELVGQVDMWRVRKGNYRAIYNLVDDRLTVVAVGDRKDIYR